jgi:hypothetical protein
MLDTICFTEGSASSLFKPSCNNLHVHSRSGPLLQRRALFSEVSCQGANKGGTKHLHKGEFKVEPSTQILLRPFARFQGRMLLHLRLCGEHAPVSRLTVLCKDVMDRVPGQPSCGVTDVQLQMQDLQVPVVQGDDVLHATRQHSHGARWYDMSRKQQTSIPRRAKRTHASLAV